jgi:FkbM family methyltransferase
VPCSAAQERIDQSLIALGSRTVPTVHSDLVFDLGMNDGSDAAFYLAKGFRVVGVEASATLCQQVSQKYRSQIECGRLVVENVAVVDREGPVEFFPNEKSVWGTTRPDWVQRNERLSHASTASITVSGTTIGSLIDKHGTPYYVKIDIEGADLSALAGLRGQAEMPAFISIESDKTSWAALEKEFDLLEAFGYTRFKVVPQQWVSRQRPLKPAREGVYAEWRFHLGDSGMFGEEAPGHWLSRAEAIRRYRQIFRRYSLFGDEGRLVPPSIAGAAVRRFLAGWYDTHAGR